MRILAAGIAAVVVAGLAFTADAAPSRAKKQRSIISTERSLAQRRTEPQGQAFGYEAMPEHFKTGTSEWWRAMDREGRGGCCGTTQ